MGRARAVDERPQRRQALLDPLEDARRWPPAGRRGSRRTAPRSRGPSGRWRRCPPSRPLPSGCAGSAGARWRPRWPARPRAPGAGPAAPRPCRARWCSTSSRNRPRSRSASRSADRPAAGRRGRSAARGSSSWLRPLVSAVQPAWGSVAVPPARVVERREGRTQTAQGLGHRGGSQLGVVDRAFPARPAPARGRAAARAAAAPGPPPARRAPGTGLTLCHRSWAEVVSLPAACAVWAAPWLMPSARLRTPSMARALVAGARVEQLDEGPDVLAGGRRPLGQLADLVGHHAEPLALGAGARGLDGGVERQDVGLGGDVLEQLDDLPHLLGAGAQRLQGAGDLGHRLGLRLGAAGQLADGAVDVLGQRAQLGGGGGHVLQVAGQALQRLVEGLAQRGQLAGQRPAAARPRSPRLTASTTASSRSSDDGGAFMRRPAGAGSRRRVSIARVASSSRAGPSTSNTVALTKRGRGGGRRACPAWMRPSRLMRLAAKASRLTGGAEVSTTTMRSCSVTRKRAASPGSPPPAPSWVAHVQQGEHLARAPAPGRAAAGGVSGTGVTAGVASTSRTTATGSAQRRPRTSKNNTSKLMSKLRDRHRGQAGPDQPRLEQAVEHAHGAPGAQARGIDDLADAPAAVGQVEHRPLLGGEPPATQARPPCSRCARRPARGRRSRAGSGATARPAGTLPAAAPAGPARGRPRRRPASARPSARRRSVPRASAGSRRAARRSAARGPGPGPRC